MGFFVDNKFLCEIKNGIILKVFLCCINIKIKKRKRFIYSNKLKTFNQIISSNYSLSTEHLHMYV